MHQLEQQPKTMQSPPEKTFQTFQTLTLGPSALF